MGNRLPEIYTKEEVFQLVEKAILLYREQGWTGERFGAFIDRIGPDNFIAQLTSDEVLARKTVHSGRPSAPAGREPLTLPPAARRLSSHALSCRQKGPSAGRAFSLAPPSAYPSNTL